MPELHPMHDLPVIVDLGQRLGRVPGVAIYRHRHPLQGWRFLVLFRLGGYLFRWWVAAENVGVRRDSPAFVRTNGERVDPALPLGRGLTPRVWRGA